MWPKMFQVLKHSTVGVASGSVSKFEQVKTLMLTIVDETWGFRNNSVQSLLGEFRPDSFQHGS